MPKSDGKLRCIAIYRLLAQETDSEHCLTIQQIIDRLQTEGISAYRKTVIADIEQLVASGIDIVCIKSSQNRYYLNSRLFTLSELKLLVDAVEASQFITHSKSADLIDRLSTMTSVHNADKLCRQIYLSRRMKSDNEEIYEVVDRCHEAIQNSRQITFRYYEYNGSKEKVFRNDGELYRFSPYGMTWDDSRYYLIGYSLKHEKIVSFRVDRMTNAEVLDCPCIPMPDGFNVADYVKRVFHMYANDASERVSLKCRNSVMKSVIDRFGMDVKTKPMDDEHFQAIVDVNVSPTFFGWVFQFDGDIQILNPESVRVRFERMGKKIFCE